MYTSISKHLCQLLRWKPELIGITLNKQGYTNVEELINKFNSYNKIKINMGILEEIVRTDDKKRYSFNEDKTMIRCNQGHGKNLGVDLAIEEKEPPEFLYHGTAKRHIESIMTTGLTAQSRMYVHLTHNSGTAFMVGKRYAKYANAVAIAKIDSGKMYRDGCKFKLSDNNVWLIETVDPKYITFLTYTMEAMNIDKYISKDKITEETI